ncbi:uncharacterized protein LOC128396856 [Panonychus citri]|uniref:uncharacterized protein LOC128396856 n=1 Tax=Panonychus citri TaxID=50023 RepID=UPI002307672B|nr:uncharacterized protein LOC128396856 [Panonychus citri]
MNSSLLSSSSIVSHSTIKYKVLLIILITINLVTSQDNQSNRHKNGVDKVIRDKRSFDLFNQNSFDPFNLEDLFASKPLKRAAMGVDLPDYILHYRSTLPNYGDFREKMQKSGK